MALATSGERFGGPLKANLPSAIGRSARAIKLTARLRFGKAPGPRLLVCQGVRALCACWLKLLRRLGRRRRCSFLLQSLCPRFHLAVGLLSVSCFCVASFHLRPRIVGPGFGRVLPQVVWRGMSWIQEEAEGKGAVPVGGVVIVLFRCSRKGARGAFVQPAVGVF